VNDRPKARAESPEERQRRLAEIFGEDPPTQTRDDQPDPGEDDDRSKDAWLKAQVPPHHG
jgi:hypothetical protein